MRQLLAQGGVVGAGDPQGVSGLTSTGGGIGWSLLMVEVEVRNVEEGLRVCGVGVEFHLHRPSEQVHVSERRVHREGFRYRYIAVSGCCPAGGAAAAGADQLVLHIADFGAEPLGDVRDCRGAVAQRPGLAGRAGQFRRR